MPQTPQWSVARCSYPFSSLLSPHGLIAIVLETWPEVRSTYGLTSQTQGLLVIWLRVRKVFPKTAVPKAAAREPINKRLTYHQIAWLFHGSGRFWERPFWNDTNSFISIGWVNRGTCMSIACPGLLLGRERIWTRVTSVAGERSNHFVTESHKKYKYDK